MKTGLIILLFPTLTLAQMATSSMFSGVKSINPAVLTSRESATFSAFGGYDSSEKIQDVSGSFGAGSELKTTGKLNRFNAYYAGKGGGFLTLEAFAEQFKGSLEVDATLADATQSGFTSTGEGDGTTLTVGLGIGKYFGISYATQSLEIQNSFKTTLNIAGNTTNIDTSSTSESNISRIRGGLRGNLGLDFGAYYESQTSDTTSSDQQATNEKKTVNTVGVGLGTSSKTSHIEVFYEKRLKDTVIQSTEGNVTYSPERYGVALEFKSGGFSFGYIGSYVSGGFTDLEKQIYNDLIYGSSQYESRLENQVNFSLGKAAKGGSFGGSASYSKVESQQISNLDSETQVPTTTTVLGASLNYTYSF